MNLLILIENHYMWIFFIHNCPSFNIQKFDWNDVFNSSGYLYFLIFTYWKKKLVVIILCCFISKSLLYDSCKCVSSWIKVSSCYETRIKRSLIFDNLILVNTCIWLGLMPIMYAIYLCYLFFLVVELVYWTHDSNETLTLQIVKN